MMNGATNFFASLAIMVPAFLLALSFHEFSHALIATLLGDQTPRRMGRLTLNPLAHIDFFGLVCLILFRIGWAKPVIFDQRNFSYPRFFSVLTAFAGPLSNFVLALVCLYGIKYLPITLIAPALYLSLMQILKATAYVNIMLGVFNLLPIPPLDGSHVLIAFLIKDFPNAVVWIYRYSFFILLLFFLLPQFRTLLTYLILVAEHFLKMLVI
jgi:Zn-dependent protease